MKRRATSALLLAGLLIGCTEPPKSGTVLDKEYDDPDEWTVSVTDYSYSCQYEFGYNTATGKHEFANICKDRAVGSHIEPRYDGPHWKLRIRDDADAENVAWVEVGEAAYETVTVGGHWPDPR